MEYPAEVDYRNDMLGELEFVEELERPYRVNTTGLISFIAKCMCE